MVFVFLWRCSLVARCRRKSQPVATVPAMSRFPKMAQIMVFTMVTSLFYAFFFFMNLLLVAGPTGNVGDVRLRCALFEVATWILGIWLGNKIRFAFAVYILPSRFVKVVSAATEVPSPRPIVNDQEPLKAQPAKCLCRRGGVLLLAAVQRCAEGRTEGWPRAGRGPWHGHGGEGALGCFCLLGSRRLRYNEI